MFGIIGAIELATDSLISGVGFTYHLAQDLAEQIKKPTIK
jgi:hypothetical protein